MKPLIALFVCLATTAQSDVTMSFRDGAPVDTFEITATDTCLSGIIAVTLDLTQSQGQLIFDVTPAGAGVEVFQPLVLTKGQNAVLRTSELKDGDQILALVLQDLSAPVGFTADLDDTIGQREITVSGSEIAGATVQIQTATDMLSGTFDTNGNAVIATPAF